MCKHELLSSDNVRSIHVHTGTRCLSAHVHTYRNTTCRRTTHKSSTCGSLIMNIGVCVCMYIYIYIHTHTNKCNYYSHSLSHSTHTHTHTHTHTRKVSFIDSEPCKLLYNISSHMHGLLLILGGLTCRSTQTAHAHAHIHTHTHTRFLSSTQNHANYYIIYHRACMAPFDPGRLDLPISGSETGCSLAS